MKTKRSALSELGRRTQEPPISWMMKMALDHPGLISLAAGFTDNDTLPVKATAAAMRRILGEPRSGQAALQYGSTLGDPELRQLTAARLQHLDTGEPGGELQPAYAPDRLILTHGSQQLLYMVAEALCDPGDFVLVEDPTYFVYLGIAQSHGLRCRGVRLEKDGLDLEHLEQVLEDLQRRGELPQLKLLYLVTYYQNPTGTTTSLEKKAQALALLRRYERAAGHPLYLLEDAAYRELRLEGQPPPPPTALAVKGATGRVILAGTYSKPFATGVRVGFGVLPEPVFTTVRCIKGNHDFGTSQLPQRLLARVLASGEYEKHLMVLRRRYAHKAQVMTRAMHHHLPREVTWTEPRGGMYLWAKLPPQVNTGLEHQLFQAALDRQVLYVPGELCYAPDTSRPKPAHAMRLSFGNATEKEMEVGIARLGEAIRASLA